MGIGTDVSWHIAFLAGIASFLSPCLLPMIPAYIMYMAGSNMAEGERVSRRSALGKTLFFVLGFTLIFLMLGLSASAIGSLFVANKMIFQRIAGVVIALLGLQFMGVIKFKSLNRNYGPRINAKQNSGIGAFVMGLSFGAGWTPCFGPVLASILVLASTSDTPTAGVLLLLVYAAGLAIPFMLTALFINEVAVLTGKIDRSGRWLRSIAGVVLVVFGLLMSMNWLVRLNSLF